MLAAALVVGSAAESAVPARTCNGWCPQDQPGHAPFLPTWKPTWDMRRSTQLMACNNSGYHNVAEAARYGVAVYDWSNAKRLWANTRPMNDDERLTAQAEMVIAADPGVKGEQPRVWQYRNTIKALNWIGQVREKLDDPAYSGWFVRFRDYKGAASNHSCATPLANNPPTPPDGVRFSDHVPACTFEKCSGFYHDQGQTPEYPSGDGSCVSAECDCGANPCGECTLPLPPLGGPNPHTPPRC